MHKYTAEFRISGHDLDPDAVSRDLGLAPSLVIRRGDRRGTSNWDVSTWAYSGEEVRKAPREWDSLEEALQRLLKTLIPVRARLRKYERYEQYFWCAHFQSSFDGGPCFSASLLQAISAFGCDLFIDTYFVRLGKGKRSPTSRSMR
jgi:hypothetical protein